jgi:hypothetical protein
MPADGMSAARSIKQRFGTSRCGSSAANLAEFFDNRKSCDPCFPACEQSPSRGSVEPPNSPKPSKIRRLKIQNP